MTTATRDAVIRIRTERSGASGGGFEARAFAAEARAAKEAAKEIEGATRGVQEHTRQLSEFGTKSLQVYGKTGAAALQLTRASALLALSSEEDAQKIIQGLVKIEAAVHGVSAAYKLLSSSAIVGLAAAMNPVTAAMLAAAVAGVALGAAIKYFSDQGFEAAQRIRRENLEAARSYQVILDKINQIRKAEQDRRLANEDFGVESAITPAARRQALESRRSALESEFSAADSRRRSLLSRDPSGQSEAVQRAHFQSLAGAEREVLDLIKEQARVQRDLLEQRKQERQEQLNRQSGLFPSLPGGRSVGGQFAEQAISSANRADEQAIQKLIDNLNKNFTQINELLESHEKKFRGLER